ncbi:hypothetical protein LTS18_003138 [Coniosporium uncinatum]|uniref:Uncharacterized protein n=1 Tax=Coniosporium uncinatum TaxID=93489 RepID=A0ACC3D7C8_9PEZI|nr:hypothetical protein LTS18_003138 [Coniosporium uncinatum]
MRIYPSMSRPEALLDHFDVETGDVRAGEVRVWIAQKTLDPVRVEDQMWRIWGVRETQQALDGALGAAAQSVREDRFEDDSYRASHRGPAAMPLAVGQVTGHMIQIHAEAVGGTDENGEPGRRTGLTSLP